MGKFLVAQKLPKRIEIVWQCTLLRLVVINKTIVQQKRIKSFHRNGKIGYFSPTSTQPQALNIVLSKV